MGITGVLGAISKEAGQSVASYSSFDYGCIQAGEDLYGMFAKRFQEAESCVTYISGETVCDGLSHAEGSAYSYSFENDGAKYSLRASREKGEYRDSYYFQLFKNDQLLTYIEPGDKLAVCGFIGPEKDKDQLKILDLGIKKALNIDIDIQTGSLLELWLGLNDTI